jgi:hypothetical protein
MTKDEKRKIDNYDALHALFQSIDHVVTKTESFIHLLDFGDSIGDPVQESETGKELYEVIRRFNQVYAKNRNKLADKLQQLIDRI